MYYFPHIPKSGGTTIKELFFAAFGDNALVKVWPGGAESGADTDEKEFANLPPAFFSERKAIIGHLSFQEMLRNPYMASLYEKGYVRSITVVRDPIDRIISLRNYMCALESHPWHKEALEMGPVNFIMQQDANFQIRFLSAFDGESAISITNRIECFTLDNSEEKVRIWLENETLISLKSIEPANVTKKQFPNFTPFRKSDLNDSELKALQIKHADDFSLYELAK